MPHRRALLRRLLARVAGGALLAHGAMLRAEVVDPAARAAAASADRPTGPIRIVVAYPPGGLSDTIARALAAQLALDLGTPVRVENQAGAGGAIALRTLARSPPDGRTLVFSAITPLAFDAQLSSASGITPLASVMMTPSLLVGTPAFRGRRFEDLLDYARQRPGALRWATSGLGTTGHLVLEQVCRACRITVTHVPYKGGGQQLTDALGGQFELLSTNVAPLQMTYVHAGRFTPLAVGAPERLDVLRDVPTLEELGCPHANLASLFGLFVPAGTPPALAAALNGAVNAALVQPQIRASLIASGNLPTGGSALAFAQEIERASTGIARLLPPR